MTIKIQGDKITFPDDSEQTTAYTGSSGGGGTDILPTLLSGTVKADGTVVRGSGFTSEKESDGVYIVSFTPPLPTSPRRGARVSGSCRRMSMKAILYRCFLVYMKLLEAHYKKSLK